ncbi:beta-L-arabinofuranosidase domain-containing protein [Aeoliella mucimassa]|uniref:beta-L-arabinofuranosidase domain-containing protein n=1 Tax=Aeoliella mucimassa TaxID=2527972 RepID=UPI0018D3B4C5|nr:beta-L-arabinofuranosidase domain-containing protein [Aeoliella mucimassa]
MTIGSLTTALAETGDQMLDGIGETAMIARYQLYGNLNDWSRNGLHATTTGAGHAFVVDTTFGKVLSLPGGTDGAFLKVPTQPLGDTESFSVTAWVNLKRSDAGQYLFDLGSDGSHHLGLVPVDSNRRRQSVIHLATGDGPNDQREVRSPRRVRLEPNKWVHLAMVLNAADKNLSLYIDGKRAARLNDINTSIQNLLNDNAHLTIGHSVTNEGSSLAALLYDVRFYRSALSDPQIAVIHHNAISDEQLAAPESSESNDSPGAPAVRSPLLAMGLVGVPNVEVSTAVGVMPRLPYELSGIYQDGSDGPQVRVIWPSPRDNSSVTTAGTYVITGQVPGTSFQPKATITVVDSTTQETTPNKMLEPFPLGQVVLMPDRDGKPTRFMVHRDLFLQGLLKTNPDRFLYVFRDAFGKSQPDGLEPLGGWDSQTTRLRGHATGHYLTALAQSYASTSYDPQLQQEFGDRMHYIIGELHRLSQSSGRQTVGQSTFNADPAQVPPGPGKSGYDSDLTHENIRTDYWNWGEGFISGYPPDQFIMLEQGASYGGGNHQVWAPYYTLHKLLAGLLDCYEVGGDPKALEVARDMGLWVHCRLSQLPEETRRKMWNSYIAGEYGGMNEVMARLYRITNDKRFLDAAMLFDNTNFFFGDSQHRHGLAKNVDTIRGRHANQHIPQIIGALETYRSSHDRSYYYVADYFWDLCAQGYMYSIGGVAGARTPNNAECFTAEPNTLFQNGLSPGGQNETCATYNLLKLSRELFMFEPVAKYMDYYERALYNHILASVDDNTPANTYHVPLNPGARKSFGNARMDGFTCCNGTALESGTKLQDSIYFRKNDDSALYVNLFIPSTLHWKSQQVVLSQSTNFPFADTTRFTLQGSGDFAIYLRVPSWATSGVTVRVNDQLQTVESTPGSYLKLKRHWNDGDTIELKLPMKFSLRPLMDQPNIASLLYGPVLLAAEESQPRRDFRTVHLPIEEIGQAISGDPTTLHFQADDAKLKPFYEFYQGFHSVYLNVDPTP